MIDVTYIIVPVPIFAWWSASNTTEFNHLGDMVACLN